MPIRENLLLKRNNCTRKTLTPQTAKGTIFDIQRFSVHDGPGIRTTIFLKGCTLRCFWCQNPEGIHLKPEVMFYPDRCIYCGNCLLACPNKAHVVKEDAHVFLREKCTACGKCAQTCYAGALVLVGREMTVDEVVDEVLRDKVFYETSGGGVTLSGGDPIVQYSFSRALLKKCKKVGLHTAIETAANCQWKILASLLPMLDLVMMDIKHVDSEKHKKATGVSNKIILNNAVRLSKTKKPLILRVPIIPGFNDTKSEVEAIAEFVKEFSNLEYLELLPFHRLGEGKYKALGLEYSASNLAVPAKEKMRELSEAVKKLGIKVRGN
ncbi:glycyl-radical enzyme activating protein [Candidatus Bathyarchaeota archaeon]|nr:glycyl-radical enzyme activating protein [Candidatus Bathyarchaeota archaeon]